MNVDEREWFDGQVTTRFGRGSGTSPASRGTGAVVSGQRGTNSGASPRTPATTVTIGLVDGEHGNGERERERERERELRKEESSAGGGRRDPSPIYRGRGEGESAGVFKHH
jgi:hypothetical protein